MIKEKKVLLIVPPKYYHKFWDIRHFANPIGIWSIASTIESKLGFPVKVLDCIAEAPDNLEDIDTNIAKMGLSDEIILKRVEEYEPDVLGLQCISSNQHEGLIRYCRLLKGHFPSLPIMVGGAHCSALPERILKDARGAIDYIVIGEGEITILELLKRIDTSELKIKGLGFWKDGKIFINESRELIPNLDFLPLLDPKFLRDIKYPENPPHSYFTFGRKWIEIMFSRGCLFSCDWCFSPIMWQRHMRKKSLENIQKQLELLWADGYRELLVEDDNLFLDPSWGVEVIKKIKEMGFYWQVAGGLHLESLTIPLIDEIARSNCSTVYCPINIIRNIGGNRIDLLLDRKYQEVFKKFKEYGIYVFSSIMLGIPDQSIESMNLQIEFMHELVSKGWVDYCVIFAFSPLPGTAWWEKVRLGSEFEFDEREIRWEQFSLQVPLSIKTSYWNYDELERLILNAHKIINGDRKTEIWFSQKEWVRA